MPMTSLILSAMVMAAMANGSAPKGIFRLGFDWGELELCTTGTPNVVPSPEFDLSGVPPGTKFIRFKLIDHDAPGFDHGGGLVTFAGQGFIPSGMFAYKSPCPPDGRHLYEWQAIALDGENGRELARASSEAFCP